MRDIVRRQDEAVDQVSLRVKGYMAEAQDLVQRLGEMADRLKAAEEVSMLSNKIRGPTYEPDCSIV